MKKAKIFAAVLVAYIIVIFGFTHNAYATTYEAYTKMFHGYEDGLKTFASAILASDWTKAKAAAEDLNKRSKEFNALAKKDNNKSWLDETDGMISHTGELIELSDGKEPLDAYLVSTATFQHINYIKSATPQWLKYYITEMVERVDEAISKKDKDAALHGAEEIHLTAHDLALSGGIVSKAYIHTRWIKDAYRMHHVGDELQEALHEGDWQISGDHMKEIKKILSKISNTIKK